MNQNDRTTKPQLPPGEEILKSARERAERLLPVWEMNVEQRVQAMRKGELSLEQCAAWAARYPEQVPILNGEFEYLAAFTPEAHE